MLLFLSLYIIVLFYLIISKVYEANSLKLLKEIKDEKSLIWSMNTFDTYLVSGSLESLKIYDTIDFNLVRRVTLPG